MREPRSGRRWRAVAAAAVAGVVRGGRRRPGRRRGPPGDGAGGRRPVGAFWPTSGRPTAGTTLKSVRSIVRADTGAAAGADRPGRRHRADRHRCRAGRRAAGRRRSSTGRTCRSSRSRRSCATSTRTGTARTWPASSSATTPPTGTVGLAPKAKLTSVKVGTADGAVDVTQMIAAIDWVVQHRNDDPANPIRVLNLSYGTGGMSASSVDPLHVRRGAGLEGRHRGRRRGRQRRQRARPR